MAGVTRADARNVKAYALSSYTGAAPTLSSTSWADVSGPSDITLTAGTGDVVMVSLSTTWNNAGAPGAHLDVVTIVSATVTNSFATAGAPNNSHEGIGSWRNANTAVAGSFYYTLQAGDVSGGQVVLRLRGRLASAGTCSFFTGANFPMYFFATNLGKP